MSSADLAAQRQDSPQASPAEWERPLRRRIRSDADRASIEKFSPFDFIPARTILECLQKSASESPEKAAIVQLNSANATGAGRRLRYQELADMVGRAAALFAETVGPGERPVVAVVCPLLIEGLLASWGAETVGTAVPINPFLKADGVASILNAAKANILVIATGEYGPGAWDQLDAITAAAPGLRRVFQVGRGSAPDREFNAALEGVPSPAPGSLKLRAGSEDALFMPTGGTTGSPKLVRQKQELQVVMAWLMGALQGCERDEVVGLGMPNFHVGGLVATSLRSALFGQTLVLLTPEGFRNSKVVANFWEIARAHGLTNVIAAPTTAAALLAIRDAKHEGHSIHTFGCGGSTIPTEVLHAFRVRFGLWLRELWGMTEFHGVTTGHPDDGREPAIGSVGRAFAFHEVKAAELDGGRFVREAAPGEKGILIARGICIGTGYVDSRAEAELFVTGMPDGEVWQSTGDIGTVEDDGHIYVHGREKDLINRGGHKIDFKEIEEALQHHPAVQISAAIGKPDPLRGELPVAYVQLKPDVTTTAGDLIAFCRDRLAERAAVPTEIVFLPALPLTAVGKIAKPVLRTDAMRRAVEDIALATLGPDDAPTVQIDETGRRPAALLQWPEKRPDLQVARKRLKEACMGFTFEVRT